MVKSAWCKIFIYKWAVRNACGGVKKDVHYSLKRSDVNVYYKNAIQSCCNVNITDEAFQCNLRKEKKKKNECLFILFARHSRSPRIGRNQHYTIDINQVLRRASIACVCMFSHTHSHTHSFSYIRLQLLTITLLIALVKIRENLEVLSFILFFPPKLSMKSALLRFRILLNLLQYLTLHEFVNNCLLLPRPEDKKKKKEEVNHQGWRRACEPPVQSSWHKAYKSHVCIITK